MLKKLHATKFILNLFISTDSSFGGRPQTCELGRTVTTTAQQLVRKCQVEKKIFQELLEMKKYQIRAGRSNETVLVKRLIKNYNKVRIVPFPGKSYLYL